jgi:predicted metalloprotease with PDZ domain
MHYRLQFLAPYEQWIDVEIDAKLETGTSVFRLPFWRPGRYEQQAYARLITDLEAETPSGKKLPLLKVDSHSWQVELAEAGPIRLRYRFYANQTDAGSSFADDQGIYVNGINLFLFQPGKEDSPCTLELDLPAKYEIAGGLPASVAGVYQFADFHQLVDTPFFAGPDLIHHTFDLAGIPTHLWFQGYCRPDLERMEHDFRAYSQAQLELYGEFPVSEYHYLFLMLPNQYRHGVEHHNSTVISMGPGYRLMEPNFYKSFLEISSHELFHTWNVKALRPEDMFPYDYSQANYSRLHYVTEGVTTYYGDLMLWKGKVWSLDQWIHSINGELRTHYAKGGKDFISLEDASFDSWVNGYHNDGAPNRKISFYTKGYLVAMLLDFTIRKSSEQQYSLDDLMYRMYQQVAKQGRGYTREDFQGIAEELCGHSLADFFAQYISGLAPLDPILKELGEYVGLQMAQMSPPMAAVARWGIQFRAAEGGACLVENIFPDSPAFARGLSIGDEVISVNHRKLSGNADELFAHFGPEGPLTLHLFHQGELREIQLPARPGYRFHIPQFFVRGDQSPEQKRNLAAWQSVGGGRQLAKTEEPIA